MRYNIKKSGSGQYCHVVDIYNNNYTIASFYTEQAAEEFCDKLTQKDAEERWATWMNNIKEETKVDEIYLGMTVKDKESNYKGKVTAITKYLYGQDKVMVESIDTTGRPIEWWYDIDRVELIKEAYEKIKSHYGIEK